MNATEYQAKADLTEQPVYLVSDVQDRLHNIHKEIQRVIRIRKPVEKPVMPDYFSDMYKNFNGTDPMSNYTWFKEYMDGMANQTG